MKTTFKTLPVEVQEQVKRTLGCYDICYVSFENGQFKVTTSIVLTAHKKLAYNRAYWTFYKDDILTKDEQIIAYVNNFRCYPVAYKGFRDYDMLREMKEIGWEARVKFDNNGNLVLIK